jgi:preprotein translocase subunit SecA
MGKVYKGLGLTVGLVKSTSTLNERMSYNLIHMSQTQN